MTFMGLLQVAVVLFLFLFLVAFTLIISPPDAWARKWMERKAKPKK